MNDPTLATNAAWLYYMDGLTQAQVAERLFVSRPTVGRLLEHARKIGIIRIEFDTSILGSLGLAQQMKETFRLDECIVIPRAPRPSQNEERLAAAAAEYLRRFLKEKETIGISWGNAVVRTLGSLHSPHLDRVTFVAGTGGIEGVVQLLTENSNFTSVLHPIQAPMIVGSSEAAMVLNNDPSNRAILDQALTSSVFVTGIGTSDPRTASALRSRLVSEEEIDQVRKKGAVGDMLAEWFDASGRIVPSAISPRRVGISLDQLHGHPHVLGIAGGEHKVAAIRGALAGGYLNTLITDEVAAEAMLGLTIHTPTSKDR